MIKVSSGSVFVYDVMLAPGTPAGALIYNVIGPDALPLPGLGGLVATIPSGALSVQLVIPSSGSQVASGLFFELRTLSWSYGAGISGHVQYRVDAPLRFPACESGVRSKIGVFDEELPDKDIDLIAAYLEFSLLVSSASIIDDAATAGGYSSLVIADAIEAIAALKAIPSLQLRLARSRSSGTNRFERQSDPDWDMLNEYLTGIVQIALTSIDSGYQPTSPEPILAFSSRVDPITGV